MERGRKSAFQTQAEEGLLSGYSTFYDQTDDALDGINDEITRLENEKYEQEGAIGWIRSQLNSHGNYLENLLN